MRSRRRVWEGSDGLGPVGRECRRFAHCPHGVDGRRGARWRRAAWGLRRGSVARRAGHRNRRSHQTFHTRLASSRGRDSLQHELSPRPCLPPDVTPSLPTPCASASSRWHSLGTADGSSNCQWVRSTKCEPRQSGQPLADRESPTCGVLAWHPTAASARSHPIAVRGIMGWPSSAGTTVWQGWASQRASGARLLRCGSGRNDGAGGAKCAAIPSWLLRRRHCRGGGSSGSQREAPRL